MKLEEKLVSLRKAKGLSQMKLAEKMNVSRQAISRWETGAAIPSSENLKYLSDLYSVSLDYLLSDSADAPEQNRRISNEPDGEMVTISDSADGGKKGKQKTAKWLAILMVVVALITVIVITYLNQKETEPIEQNTVKFEELQMRKDAAMKRTVATVGLVCALMIGCMGMPPVRAAESDTDKVTTDIGTKVMPFEELSVEVVDSMSIPSMTRATSRIEWNISPDTVMKADTAYSLEADEIVTINCTYSPRTANLDFGFITQDDTFHFTSGSNGSIKTNIQIDKTGKYYFAVRNNENETVEVLGYVYY